MKKILLLIASAALLFAGCTRELSSGKAGGEGDVQVTFQAALPELTKAAIDNDGEGKKVNHWILEVRDSQNDLFIRQEHDADEGVLTHSFTFNLFKHQTYTLQFWADTKGAYSTGDLTEISAFDNVANKDSRDAFSANVVYKSTKSETKSVNLYRPFGQLNIITTDLEKMKGQIVEESVYMKYIPKDLKVVATVPTKFNVQTQVASELAETTVTADECYGDFQAAAAKTTIYMDYVFASAEEKDLVDIAFDFKSNSNPIAYNFSAIPLQRNYRTNILGDFLCDATTWNVEIKPAWTGEYDITHEAIPGGIEELNGKLASATGTEVEFEIANPADSDSYSVQFTSNNDNQIIRLNFIGATAGEKIIAFDKISGNGPDELYLTALEGTSFDIVLPNTHVEVAGDVNYNGIGAATSDNCLVIAKGTGVNKLTIYSGALEIHGTVNSAEVDGTAKVRECEGLSQDVYDALKNYIDAPRYQGVQNGTKWDIVKVPAASMNGKNYEDVEDAFAAVNDQPGDDVVITLNRDVVETMGADYTFEKNVTITSTIPVNMNLNCATKFSIIENGSGKTLTINPDVKIENICQVFAGYGAKDSKVILKGNLHSKQIWSYSTGHFFIVPGAKIACDYGDGMVKFRYDSDINVEDNLTSAAALNVRTATPQFSAGYMDGDKNGNKVLNMKNTFVKTGWLTNSGNGSFAVNMDNAAFLCTHDGPSNLTFGPDATGTVDMKNGSRIVCDGTVSIKTGDTVNIEAGSTIETWNFNCAGTININAGSATADKILVIKASTAATYPTVNITAGNYVALVEGKDLYIQKAVAMIGTVGYASLEAAFAAVQNNQTISIVSTDELPCLNWNRDLEAVTINGSGTAVVKGINFDGLINSANHSAKNIVLSGIKFTKSVRFIDATCSSKIDVDGLKLDNCAFEGPSDIQKISGDHENNLLSILCNADNGSTIKNVNVDGCSVKNSSYDGIYVTGVTNFAVADSKFDNCKHCAIFAGRSSSGQGYLDCDGEISYTGNEFKNIADRVVKFDFFKGTKVTITGNDFSQVTGDDNNEIGKGTSPQSTYTLVLDNLQITAGTNPATIGTDIILKKNN